MIHHVQLACPAGSEDALRGFYRDMLGLSEKAKPALARPRRACRAAGGGRVPGRVERRAARVPPVLHCRPARQPPRVPYAPIRLATLRVKLMSAIAGRAQTVRM